MDKILAQVGALTVTEAEVEEFLVGMGQRGMQYNSPEGRKMILEQLIADKLFLQDARRNLYEAEADFRLEFQKMKDALLVRYASSKALKGVTVSDVEVREYYDANKAQFMSPATVDASHILVSSRDEALNILRKINAGEISFEDAAREYSSCPSKENGGSLGEFGQGQMVPEFDKAVFAMTEGSITEEPVETQFGFHLIKLNKKNDSQVTPFEQIESELREALTGEKMRAAYQSKINQLKIMYPVDIL